MKKLAIIAAVLAFAAVGVQAGDAPKFMQQTYPDKALQGAWNEMHDSLQRAEL